MNTNNIPQDSASVKDNLENSPPKEIHLSKTEWRYYDLLCGMEKIYIRENKLQPDGSFFKSNDFFVKKLGVARMWVQKMKKKLKEKDLIDFTTKPGRGNATSYWIINNKPKQTYTTVIKTDFDPSNMPEVIANLLKVMDQNKAQKFLENRGLWQGNYTNFFPR